MFTRSLSRKTIPNMMSYQIRKLFVHFILCPITWLLESDVEFSLSWLVTNGYDQEFFLIILVVSYVNQGHLSPFIINTFVYAHTLQHFVSSPLQQSLRRSNNHKVFQVGTRTPTMDYMLLSTLITRNPH